MSACACAARREPTRDAEPGQALLCRGVPELVAAARDFHAGRNGGGPLVTRGTVFRLEPPEILAAGYEQQGGDLVLLAPLAAGLLFVGDLVPAIETSTGAIL